MQLLAFTIFWMLGIVVYCTWAMYHWYWNKFTNQDNNNTPKVVYDCNSCKRHSTSSIESLQFSDNEGTRRKNMQKLKHEIKTRWPSKTSTIAR